MMNAETADRCDIMFDVAVVGRSLVVAGSTEDVYGSRQAAAGHG